MDIRNIKFLTSKPDVHSCPETDKPEYAFIGRSNVGKSSLINMLANNKKLAKTSSTPGKTRLINYFFVNEEWFLVDLPGYGYAKLSKTDKANLAKLVDGYIQKRKQLICMFVLIDIRHNPLKADIDFIQMLGEQQVAFVIVFTKCDKLKEVEVETNLGIYKEELSKSWEQLPEIILTSSEKGWGKKALLEYIGKVNAQLK